jgi:hypothetical protein
MTLASQLFPFDPTVAEMKDEVKNGDITLTVTQRLEVFQRVNHNIPWNPEFQVREDDALHRIGFDDRKWLKDGHTYTPERPST